MTSSDAFLPTLPNTGCTFPVKLDLEWPWGDISGRSDCLRVVTDARVRRERMLVLVIIRWRGRRRVLIVFLLQFAERRAWTQISSRLSNYSPALEMRILRNSVRLLYPAKYRSPRYFVMLSVLTKLCAKRLFYSLWHMLKLQMVKYTAWPVRVFWITLLFSNWYVLSYSLCLVKFI